VEAGRDEVRVVEQLHSQFTLARRQCYVYFSTVLADFQRKIGLLREHQTNDFVCIFETNGAKDLFNFISN
jgi:hypothetical protein